MTRNIANEAQNIDRIVRTIIMHEIRERDDREFFQNHGRVMDTLRINLGEINVKEASAIVAKQLREL